MDNLIRSNKMLTLKIAITCFLIFVLGKSSNAQHDAHREAVIEMARGDYDAAEERIQKVIKDPSSVWRGLINAYERAGKTPRWRRFAIGGRIEA